MLGLGASFGPEVRLGLGSRLEAELRLGLGASLAPGARRFFEDFVKEEEAEYVWRFLRLFLPSNKHLEQNRHHLILK